MSYAGVTEFCPNCHKEEDTKIVDQCKHCGYVYKEDEETKVSDFLIKLFILYIIATVIFWFIQADIKSLLDILREQFAWIKNLRLI